MEIKMTITLKPGSEEIAKQMQQMTPEKFLEGEQKALTMFGLLGWLERQSQNVTRGVFQVSHELSADWTHIETPQGAGEIITP